MAKGESFLERLKRGGIQEIIYKAVEYGWLAWVYPVFLGAGAVLTGWTAFISKIDPLPKLAFAALAMGCFIWLARQTVEWMRGASRHAKDSSSQQFLDQSLGQSEGRNDAVSRPFGLHYVSGKTEDRAVIEDIRGERWTVLSVCVMNLTDTTKRDLNIFISCRTWRDGSVFRTYKDVESIPLVVDAKHKHIHPDTGLEFVLLAQHCDEPERLFLGDLRDSEDTCVSVEEHGLHFITISVSAEDTRSTLFNLVVKSFSDPKQLYALEYDMRRWGHHDSAPFPIAAYEPRQF